jgi:hypothetical protein
MSSRTNPIAAIGVLTALALSTLAASPAAAKSGAVKRAGHCTARSASKIKLAHDNNAVEAEFEVDSNRVGQRWNVAIADNGVRVFSGARTTKAPSGSFTVRIRTRDRSGIDKIVATAKNRATGETCVARASV